MEAPLQKFWLFSMAQSMLTETNACLSTFLCYIKTVKQHKIIEYRFKMQDGSRRRIIGKIKHKYCNRDPTVKTNQLAENKSNDFRDSKCL